MSDVVLIPYPFNSAPLELLDVSLSLLSCASSSSYITLYSLLYLPSFLPYSGASPYAFSVVASESFSLSEVACPQAMRR